MGTLMIVTVLEPTWVSEGQEPSPLPDTLHCGIACGLTTSPGGRSTRTSCSESNSEVLTVNCVRASAGCEPAWVAYWPDVGGLDGLVVFTTPAWKLLINEAAAAGLGANSPARTIAATVNSAATENETRACARAPIDPVCAPM